MNCCNDVLSIINDFFPERFSALAHYLPLHAQINNLSSNVNFRQVEQKHSPENNRRSPDPGHFLAELRIQSSFSKVVVRSEKLKIVESSEAGIPSMLGKY